MSQEKSDQIAPTHDAFVIRKMIVTTGLMAGAAIGCCLTSVVVGVIGYSVAVCAADAFFHYGLRWKSSHYIDVHQLARREQVSPQQLDRYHDTRRYCRFVAFGTATLSQLIFLSPLLFCLIYGITTVVSLFYTKFVLHIEGPVWIRRNDQYYCSSTHRFFDTSDTVTQGNLGYGPMRYLRHGHD